MNVRTRIRRRVGGYGVRRQLTIVSAFVLVVALAISGAVMLLMLHRENTAQMYRATGRQAYQIATAVNRGGVSAVDPDDLTPGAGIDITQVVDDRGVVVAASPGAPRTAIRVADDSNADESKVRYADHVNVPGYGDEFCASVNTAYHADREYTILALDKATGIRSSEWTTATLMAIELPIIVALGAGAVYLLVGRSLRPVSRITKQANEITSTELEQRVPVPTADDEIRTLAVTVNSMLGRLQRGRESQLRFIGDASHELRSPLTTLVGLLDLADDTSTPIDVETVRTILLPEARRMQAMAEDLLLLARADEQGLTVVAGDVDLDDVVVEEVARLRAMEAAKVTAHVVPVRVSGDREMIRRAVRNLVDNATRHCDSAVWVSLRADRSNAVIAVSDDGPGIPDDRRSVIFDRFSRLDVDRQRDSSGAGLGLAIAYEIAQAHGGSVSVVDGSHGGATFELVLPLGNSSDGSEESRSRSERDQTVPGAPDRLDGGDPERGVDALT
ncbi:ATP-binding protein [Gordonia sp. w5E2]|uniref:histidine kinase n=1 Tax=Gordonia jacobaea TaxID=122202 RepID=A0ABR5IA26_9ACTN|nr:MULTISPECIES: ATP-binding protein [Gordonia]KNA90462.1 histidine kinase [Gordonia jacobaea]